MVNSELKKWRCRLSEDDITEFLTKTKLHEQEEEGICTMTSFYYYDQNPLGFCFLVQIGTFVIQTSLGLPNLNMKEKTKRILVEVAK